MTLTQDVRTRPRHAAPAPERAELFAGTGGLLRLFLRLDRVRIVVWALSLLAIVAGSVVSLEATYTTPESLQSRAALMTNPAAIMMTGPAFALDDYTFGAMIANELSLYVFLAAAVMSVLLAVRHTRQEEESGRLESLRALPVGRFAPPTAAVVTVAIANLAVGVAVAAGLLLTGMETADSAAFGLATALTGLVFGAIAVVAAQLTEHARSATGMSLGAVAVAYLVRGAGDVIDNEGSWLSWFSPFAWSQQTRVYVDLRWWPLAVSGVAVLVLLALAVALSRRRDLGAGVRAPSPGPASASPRLLSPAGLALRLTGGTFLAWAIGLFLFSIAFGMLATALEDMIDDTPMLQEWMTFDIDDLTRSFGAVILTFLVIGGAALLVSGVLQLRGEEQSGRVEALVVSGTSRPGLLAGWLAVVTVLSLLVLVVTGTGLGVGMVLATGQGFWVGEMALASLVYAPAVLLLGSVAVALLGLVPRLAGWAWLPVVWAALVVFLGDLLNLPAWARDLSPLHHTPLVPGADLEPAPLLVMTALTVVLTVAGAVALRRRDLGAA